MPLPGADVVDFTIIGAALIAAVPATIAALATFKTNRLVRTNHGKTLGEHVERIGDNLNELNRAFDRHSDDDARRFDEVAALLKEQDRAATTARQDLHNQAAETRLDVTKQIAAAVASPPLAGPVPITMETPVPVIIEE